MLRGFLAMVVLFVPTVLAAQGADRHCGSLRNIGAAGSVTVESGQGESVAQGTLLEVNEAEGYVFLVLDEGRKKVGFPLAQSPKLRAGKKTRLRGIRSPTLGDLRPGDMVKVTVRDTDRAAVALRLLPEASSPTASR